MQFGIAKTQLQNERWWLSLAKHFAVISLSVLIQVSQAAEDETASLMPDPPSTYEGILEDTLLPENPHAIDHCLAKIRVESARLRESPSLSAAVVGSRQMDQAVFVEEVMGKWARVHLDDGSQAFIATYLLTFSWQDILDQWKKGAPLPTVGKKAKVKWVNANVRAYPSTKSPRMGGLRRHDVVAVLGETQPGWTFVQVDGAFGFIATRALQNLTQLPPEYAHAPLAKVQTIEGIPKLDKVLPRLETPTEYLARTAWSPAVFQMAWQSQKAEAIAMAKIGWEQLDEALKASTPILALR